MALISFLKALFTASSTPPEIEPDYQRLKFNPKLVQSLKGDHQAILGIFGQIQTAVQNHQDQDLYEALQEFGVAMKTHLYEENVKFYYYIEKKYLDDADIKKRIHYFRVEMEGIAVALNRFLREHTVPMQTPEQWMILPGKLSELAKALGKRIHDEETELYAMYRP